MIFKEHLFNKENIKSRLFGRLGLLSIVFIWVSLYLGYFINPENQDIIFAAFHTNHIVDFKSYLLIIVIQIVFFVGSIYVAKYFTLFFLLIIAAINYSCFWCLHKLESSFPKIEFQPCLDTAFFYFLILCLINLIISINTKSPFILSFLFKLLDNSAEI